jgi:hypothetical protein
MNISKDGQYLPRGETRTYDDLTVLEREQFWSQLSECGITEDKPEESNAKKTSAYAVVLRFCRYWILATLAKDDPKS